jgi:hypothetical protein
MSEPLHDEAEILDGLPVLSDEPTPVNAFPAPTRRALVGPLVSPVQTVVVAAGGFVAGAAVFGLAHRRRGKRTALARPGSPRRLRRSTKREQKSVAEIVEIVASRTLLVDVHLLGSPSSPARNR